jgi:hypothetical protein
MKLLGLMLIAFFLMGVGSCANGPEVKIYSSQPDKGGLVRAQANEFIPYQQTKDFLCLTPSDAEALLNYCLSPTDEKKK